ncbi:MAG: flagellar hook-basal body complex protein FliE, partial [Candidatus Atribacteria bacterium]|nr:flagellar hook-basal body complex protein FliE [Candidatus Atribacteria bacterium]MCD6350243.1 flagellar hook-basal body complex protein FliE [Candidatus Atribacteria bacterium]
MDVNRISGVFQGVGGCEVTPLKEPDKDGKSFSELVGGFLKRVNSLQKEADQAIQDMVLGKEE